MSKLVTSDLITFQLWSTFCLFPIMLSLIKLSADFNFKKSEKTRQTGSQCISISNKPLSFTLHFSSSSFQSPLMMEFTHPLSSWCYWCLFCSLFWKKPFGPIISHIIRAPYHYEALVLLINWHKKIEKRWAFFMLLISFSNFKEKYLPCEKPELYNCHKKRERNTIISWVLRLNLNLSLN